MPPDPTTPPAIGIASGIAPAGDWYPLSDIRAAADRLPADQWFSTPPNIGRGPGLGWAQALAAALREIGGGGWRLMVDCGDQAGDALMAMRLDIAAIIIDARQAERKTDRHAAEDIAEHLSSVAEQRRIALFRQPPALLPLLRPDQPGRRR